MGLADLSNWMDEFSGQSFIWYAKRLSGNDTLANNSHQAGPYIPKDFLFSVLPDLNRKEIKNPDVRFDLLVDSHADRRQVRAIWYNNKFHENPKGGRNETRLTNFGGAESALLNPDNTGALAVFAFRIGTKGEDRCRVWVCRNPAEEEIIEERIGPVEPGKWTIWSPVQTGPSSLFEPAPSTRTSCWLDPAEIPAAWLQRFPTGAEIIHRTVELRADRNLDADERLLRRRECEFEIFRSVEHAVELPFIQKGFTTIDDFIARAQTILQRRKARSGRSLELHAREIFIEEGLKEGQGFAHQPESDPGKRPDFLFPSEAAYKNSSFMADKLRMLAVKTTCKDRWRQILNEADRIPKKHLLTLQEGVSENQFKEMTDYGVQLVVPQRLVGSYPEAVRGNLLTLGQFIADVHVVIR